MARTKSTTDRSSTRRPLSSKLRPLSSTQKSTSSMSDATSHLLIFFLSWILLRIGAFWLSSSPAKHILAGALGSYLFVFLLGFIAHFERVLDKTPGWFEVGLCSLISAFITGFTIHRAAGTVALMCSVVQYIALKQVSSN